MRARAAAVLITLTLTASAHAQELPSAPKVSDPMLTPMPPAQRNVSSWEEALQYVRSNSTDLRVQMNEVLRAEAQTRTALAAALPSLNLSASATHQLITNDAVVLRASSSGQPVPDVVQQPTPNTVFGGLTLNQPVLNLPAWFQIGTQRQNENVARLSLADTKRVIALNVASALVGVVTAERLAELNRIGLQTALERWALTQRRRELGGANQLDVVRGQQDVESARGTLVTGDESLRQSRESLGLALGIAGPVGVSRDTNLNGLEESAKRACTMETDVMSRADLVAQRKRIEVAQRNVDVVKLQFAPTLDARSALTSSSVDQGSVPRTQWNIQAVLTWQIWEGGARYGRMREARVNESNAEQQLESLRRTATVQVTQARRAVEVADSTRTVAAAARALAADVDRLTRIGFQEGRGTSLELVIAAAALRQAEVTLALREFDLVRARILAILALSTCPW